MAFVFLAPQSRLDRRAQTRDQNRSLAALFAFCVAALACASSVQAQDEPEILNWEDLMPEGEIELVMQLRDEYYAQVQEQWLTPSQTPLSEVGELDVGLPDPFTNDPLAGFAEGGAMDFMPQLGTFNTVEDLDGALVRMPGYVVPLNFSADNRHTQFLLVPYFGACLHTPPPPPNQIVYITAEEAAHIEKIWEPIWVEGVMTTERNENDTGNAAYTLALSSFEYFQY